MNNYLQAIILYAIEKFQGERSIFAIYHMLQGKKSSQTIQDAHLFGLTNVFGTVPRFTRDQLNQNIRLFIEMKLIDSTGKDDVYMISEQGRGALTAFFIKCPLPSSMNGWNYQSITQDFWRRLTLLIQTISHIVHNERSFYPIQQNQQIQEFVKFFLSTNRQNRELLAQHLYDELVTLLELQSDLSRDIFVLKITGVNRVGLTFEQIGKRKEIDEWYVQFVFLGSLHHILAEISTESDYPLLASLINDWKNGGNLHMTQSTQTTLHYIHAGKTIPEIAEIRRLKGNTIEDHLVEIVLSDKSFSIQDYVSNEDENQIITVIKDLKTRKLKAIKEAVDNDQISFFQIRLVLAKIGDRG
ncbi:helix-turn-helix domain-containing protein [Peribacillus sp. NPDC097675]|uniref:helix-turn-helix domain-containing protein n=1 Tax=Peribacillus sp. NPDC097675 TaxID=3390618 RepID=UPI003D06B062